jgi:hypothetical protein
VNDLRDAAEWITAADRVLITAGAGLSAAAGFDYTDRERFAELFPALHRAGFRARYEMIGRDLPPEYLWGFWAVHTEDIRFNPEPSPLYQRLRGIIDDRGYFVMTSNVDQLFSRNGFDSERIYTPQGDYGLYQCLTPPHEGGLAVRADHSQSTRPLRSDDRKSRPNSDPGMPELRRRSVPQRVRRILVHRPSTNSHTRQKPHHEPFPLSPSPERPDTSEACWPGDSPSRSPPSSVNPTRTACRRRGCGTRTRRTYACRVFP